MDFKQLTLDEQIELFNKELKKDKSLSFTKACNLLGIAKSTFSEKLKKNSCKFDTENKQIIRLNISISNDKKLNVDKKIKSDKSDFDKKIEEMYKWYQEQLEKDKKNNNLLIIDKSKFNGEMKHRTFKLYKNVSDKLDLFIKNNSQYSIQDIINTAILEFLNNR